MIVVGKEEEEKNNPIQFCLQRNQEEPVYYYKERQKLGKLRSEKCSWNMRDGDQGLEKREDITRRQQANDVEKVKLELT